jgi:glycosyltransferase involved in cell wall biosynthesis
LLNYKDPKIGGTGIFMKRIFEALNEERSFILNFKSITIFTPINIDLYNILSIPNETNIEIKKISFINRLLIFRILYEQFVLPFKMKNKNQNFYFSPNPQMPFISKILKPKIKYIITVHDMIPFLISDKYPFIRSIYIKTITYIGAKLANLIITVSNSSKQDIIRICKINENKIKIIYNFLYNKKFQPSEILENYFFTICTIEPGKNIELMLSAFKIFLDTNNKYSDYKYFIAGKNGWDYENIYKYCTKLGLDSNVIFLGYISEEKKNILLSKSVALLYVSKYEGFGIPILEAMYYNVPSIVSNISSLPEVVGDTGIIIDKLTPTSIAEAMIKVINHRDEYIRNIQLQIEKFDYKIQINNFKKIFNNTYEW